MASRITATSKGTKLTYGGVPTAPTVEPDLPCPRSIGRSLGVIWITIIDLQNTWYKMECILKFNNSLCKLNSDYAKKKFNGIFEISLSI
jgi:hypothetical protein